MNRISPSDRKFSFQTPCTSAHHACPKRTEGGDDDQGHGYLVRLRAEGFGHLGCLSRQTACSTRLRLTTTAAVQVPGPGGSTAVSHSGDPGTTDCVAKAGSFG